MPFVHLSDFFQKRDSEMVRARSQVRDHCQCSGKKKKKQKPLGLLFLLITLFLA